MRQKRFLEENTTKTADPKLYGFVSRGEDNRLQKSELAQRAYFDWILETFKQVDKSDVAPKQGSVVGNRADKLNNAASSEQILASLRKLREALLHQGASEFSKKVHLFSVRVSSAVGHYQTYIPSIQYLLSDARSLLTSGEYSEVASLLVLHVAHRNSNNCEALRLFFHHLDPHKHSRVLRTILAWGLGDYHAWMHLYNTESDHSMFAVMSMGLPAMLAHMVACIRTSYFTYPWEDLKKDLPKGLGWDELKHLHADSWELEGGIVHVRKRQRPRPKIQGEMVRPKPSLSLKEGNSVALRPDTAKTKSASVDETKAGP